MHFLQFVLEHLTTIVGEWVGGGRLDELKIQLSSEPSIEALFLRTFTGRYLNVRQIELKTRGNT